MNEPVYQVPDEESYPPPSGRRAAQRADGPAPSQDFAQVPPTAAIVDADRDASVPLSTVFPSASPAAVPNYANSSYPEIRFDPNAPLGSRGPSHAAHTSDFNGAFNLVSYAAPSRAPGNTPSDMDDLDSDDAQPFDLDGGVDSPSVAVKPFGLDDLPAPPGRFGLVVPAQAESGASNVSSSPVQSFPAPLPPLGSRSVEPAVIEVPMDLGLGQTGSDPDLVAALNIVVALGGSDLHISVDTAPMVRIDGRLEAMPGFDVWDREKVTIALHSIMTLAHQEHFEEELELDFAYTLSRDSRFRVNIYQQRSSLGAAFRLIPYKIKPLSELGVPESIGKFAALPRGLVLVTGPTGSGKSTTLAGLIDLVNRTRADHIVTVEDPIEFMHENKKSLINQREVGHDTHSFVNALKHVLRQDPDVILIGELRDLETISVALTAAETGHLVFATLHTQDAAQTIDRVIDVFPPHQQGQVRAQLAAVLQGVVCQTLVKSASGKGRVVATEVMVATSAIGNLIREGKTYQIHSALQAGRDLGMFTLDQHLAELVDAGKVTHAAAMEKAHDTEGLKQLIHRADAGGNADHKMSTSGVDFGDKFSSMPVTR
jgi:twitching motility protein PilT